MTRIAHTVPMEAFDYVADKLRAAAGPDGIVSRKDAKSIERELRAEGRGTEALLAHNLYKLADKREVEDGARITGADLQRLRPFVEAKMLERLDKNHNGYSQDEIARMSPTGKALVELGRTREAGRSKSRVGHDVPEKGMEHVARLIKGTAGPDGIVSRDDIRRLQGELYEQGRGTESQAVGYFAGFIDHRDHEAGARITATDIDRAVAYAKEHLLENKDKNRNGYSKAEIDKMSVSARTFLIIGEMVEAGII
jgi:hypothetical protein